VTQEVKIEIDGVLAGWIDVDRKNLDFIGVVEEFRGQGIAVQLIEELFVWMRKSKIRYLTFLDNSQEFWAAMKTRYPKNIFINQRGEGRIYAHI